MSIYVYNKNQRIHVFPSLELDKGVESTEQTLPTESTVDGSEIQRENPLRVAVH